MDGRHLKLAKLEKVGARLGEVVLDPEGWVGIMEDICAGPACTDLPPSAFSPNPGCGSSLCKEPRRKGSSNRTTCRRSQACWPV
jgi:hypothetical protein